MRVDFDKAWPPLAKRLLEEFMKARAAEVAFPLDGDSICEGSLPDGKRCPLARWRPGPSYGMTSGLPYEGEFARTRFCKFHLFKEDAPPIRLNAPQINALPEYSSSLPTGTRIGKTWKRRNYAAGYPTW